MPKGGKKRKLRQNLKLINLTYRKRKKVGVLKKFGPNNTEIEDRETGCATR